MTYEKLLEVADDENITVKFDRLKKIKGVYIDKIIILSDDLETEAEKKVILAEELGHHFTNYGNILNQDVLINRKEENRGKKWAYERLITLDMLIDAFEEGIKCRYCLAQYLEVTESFLFEAVEHYRKKYGCYKEHKGYLIKFCNFGIIIKL